MKNTWQHVFFGPTYCLNIFKIGDGSYINKSYLIDNRAINVYLQKRVNVIEYEEFWMFMTEDKDIFKTLNQWEPGKEKLKEIMEVI